MPPETQRGFSLLELSIVLIIAAVILGMGFTTGVSVLTTARLSGTQRKMNFIEQALMQYRTATDRLPCPGDLTLAPGSPNYGFEAANPGTCVGGTPAPNFTGTGVTNTFETAVEGALPAVTLGLPPSLMLDGWGNKFRYAVDVNYTALAGFIAAGGARCLNGAITVYDANGNPRSSNAIYALISHGANGHGAYTQNGAVVNAGSVNTFEQTNCHCNSSATATTYTPTYVQMLPSLSPTNPLDSFDDLVAYKERWQMQTQWDSTGPCTYVYVSHWNDPPGTDRPSRDIHPDGENCGDFRASRKLLPDQRRPFSARTLCR
jgi:prepilin-type N-terminal cleavage/methylation domain-containing protein